MRFPHGRGPRGLRRLCRRLVFRRGRRQLRPAAVPGDGGHGPLLAGRAAVFPAAGAARRPPRSRHTRPSGAPAWRPRASPRWTATWPQARQRLLMQPWWLDWTAGLFPVILAVFVLRSFLFEPFKIPSGSMIPTLLVGDLILVNKFTYGLRLPVINTKLTEGTPPAARRRDGVPLPAQAEPGLHQARGRRAGRRGGLPQQAAHHQRPAGAQDAAAGLLRRGRACATSSSSRKRWAASALHILNDDGRPAFIPGVDNFPFQAELPLQCRGRGLQGARRATIS